jgi:hypothetical protein
MSKLHMKRGAEVVTVEHPKPNDHADLQRYGMEVTRRITEGFEECEAPGEPAKPAPKKNG